MRPAHSQPCWSRWRGLLSGISSRRSGLHRWVIAAFAILCACSTGRTAEPQMPVYRWEAKKFYRFQINRRSEVTPADAEKPGNGRVTDCRFILLIEVDSVDPAGTATGDLRFMTPQVTLPSCPRLTEDDRGEVLDAAQSWRNARAMEEILSTSKWHVTIAANGAIRMPEHQPENWRTWMERLEQTGAWPKQLNTKLNDLLDTHVRVGQADADDEWLPVLATGTPAGHGGGLRAFRPRREVRVDRAAEDERIHLRMQREVSVEPEPVVVPLLESQLAELVVTRGDVKSLRGEAVFDRRLGLLDSATEQYRAKLTSRCGALTQQATVWVTYEVRRLAPPLRTRDEEEASKVP